jgi:hypothetical protein
MTYDADTEVAHCLGRDQKCTCPCGKGMRPEFSRLREERGRICEACQYEEGREKAEAEMEACICSWNEFSGRSVCGHPCPVHGPQELCQVSAPFGQHGGRVVCHQPMPCRFHPSCGLRQEGK